MPPMYERILNFLFNSDGFIPHGYCLQWQPGLMTLHIFSSAVIGISYFAIPLGILLFVKRRRDLHIEHKLLAGLFAAFILSCGLTHWIEIYTIWYPSYGLQGVVKAFTAVVSLLTVVALIPLLPKFLALPTPGQLKIYNDRLMREVKAHNETLRKLRMAKTELEAKVEERTSELLKISHRYEFAMKGAYISVTAQDANLKYIWASNQPTQQDIVGKSDFEIFNPEMAATILAVKKRVLASATQQESEVSYQTPAGPRWCRLHVAPTFDDKGMVDGVISVEVDVTLMKAMEREQIRLTTALASNLQQYQLALKTSNVVVYTQDRESRYISINRAVIGLEPAQIIGKVEADILPPETIEAIAPVKRRVMETGEPQSQQVSVTIDGKTQWFESYYSPQKTVGGEVVGIVCASIEITERKQWEEHLRLLMRELTHRSKNLLAVIQAMARQSAHGADSIDGFLERFSARLQALSGSHDLLVKESWHGAPIKELIISQLGHYADKVGSQISMEGPNIFIVPEAAQNLGMALHEMATNAAKYGSLSSAKGTIEIKWSLSGKKDARALKLSWKEDGGPKVKKPTNEGFGTQIITRNLKRSLNAEVEFSYASSGFSCVMVLPKGNFSEK